MGRGEDYKANEEQLTTHITEEYRTLYKVAINRMKQLDMTVESLCCLLKFNAEF